MSEERMGSVSELRRFILEQPIAFVLLLILALEFVGCTTMTLAEIL